MDYNLRNLVKIRIYIYQYRWDIEVYMTKRLIDAIDIEN
jgi:hypothetical protein